MSEQADTPEDTSSAAQDARPEERPARGTGAGAKVLGVERYVQFGFIAAGGVLFWILDKVILLVWNEFAEPPTTLVSAIAFAAGVAGAIGLYFNPRIHTLATEVGHELAKVTWPTRKETSAATVVVLVTSVLAALYLGGLDFFWSALTDLIYSTRV